MSRYSHMDKDELIMALYFLGMKVGKDGETEDTNEEANDLIYWIERKLGIYEGRLYRKILTNWRGGLTQ